jgi:iron(III) transport system ATP-binding protein
MSLLKVSRISKRQANNTVVQEISFELEAFSKMAIVGESGSGKSTLLKMIAGLMQPDTGEVLFESERVKGPDEKLIPGHAAIAYLSQHFELRNNYRVEELLSYANTLPGNEAAALYEVCRIDHLLKRKTDQLSGGEKQRIAMARLLIGAPKLLLLDEPFSNLDRIHKMILTDVLQYISEKLKITCLLVSHDPVDILTWATEIMIMKDGVLLQKGTPEQVYRQPVNVYAGALLGNYNLINPAVAGVFAALTGIAANGRQLFIRPGHIKIAAPGTPAVSGKVHKVAFAGNAYEVAVLVGDALVYISTIVGDLKKGDNVDISFATSDVWYINSENTLSSGAVNG